MNNSQFTWKTDESGRQYHEMIFVEPKKSYTKARHTQEERRALLKQALLWIYNQRNSVISYSDIRNKCKDLKISHNLQSALIKLNVLEKNKFGGFLWNSATNIQNMDEIITNIIEVEKQMTRNAWFNKKQKIRASSVVITKGPDKLDYIIEKLNAISKAIGIQ